MRYRHIFESLGVGVVLMTEVFEECNEQACLLWACAREDIIGHSLLDFSPPKQPTGHDSAEVAQKFINATLSGRPQNFHWNSKRKDGVLINLKISMKAITVDGRRVIVLTIYENTRSLREVPSLLESDKYFKTLMRVSPVGIFQTNTEGQFLFVSQRWCDITGFSQEEALEKGFAWGIHADDRERVLNEWCDAAGQDCPFNSEYRMVHPDGAISWVLGQFVGDKEKNGETVGYVGTITDITERKQIEEALKERNEFTEIVLENLPIGLVVLSFDELKIQYLNSKIEEIVGWQRDKLLDLNTFLEKTIPDETSRNQAIHKVCADLRSGDLKRMVWDLEIVKGSKEEAYVLIFGIPMPGRNQVILTVQDITERKQSEKTLKESEERFRALVDQASDSFFLMDSSGNLLDVNQAACRGLGYTRDELLLMSISDIDPGFTPDHHIEKFWLPLQRGQSILFEGLHKRKDGTTFPVEVVLGMIELRKGKRFLGIQRDLTRRKLAEEALRKSEERRYRLQVELECAAEVQKKLLPPEVPIIAGFEVAATCQPAYQVAGDFYDWQQISSGILTLTLGDVMGKGMAAAMLMATVRAALRGVVRKGRPAITLQLTEKALHQDLDRSDSFVTLFHGHLDTVSRSLTYVDCGHGFAFLLRRDGRVEELLPRGLPLGVSSKVGYQEGAVSFEGGDSLVLYSDGLIDALPELPLDNRALAAQLKGASSAEEMIDRLAAMVPPDTPRSDDLTILVVHCKEEIQV